MIDLLEREEISLQSLEMVVLDEADRMLDMGFFPDIMWVIERMTNREQTLLFLVIQNGKEVFILDQKLIVVTVLRLVLVSKCMILNTPMDVIMV